VLAQVFHQRTGVGPHHINVSWSLVIHQRTDYSYFNSGVLGRPPQYIGVQLGFGKYGWNTIPSDLLQNGYDVARGDIAGVGF
jgi:hypothetical protein